MIEQLQVKKAYAKPLVRRVDLSLREVALGSTCLLITDPDTDPLSGPCSDPDEPLGCFYPDLPPT